MKTILNVGLGPSKAAPNGISLGRAVDAIMRSFGSAYLEFRTVTDGEPTVVVVVDAPLLADQISRLSGALDQDCIASVRVVGGLLSDGALHGPHAADWRPFDPAQFILPTRNI